MPWINGTYFLPAGTAAISGANANSAHVNQRFTDLESAFNSIMDQLNLVNDSDVGVSIQAFSQVLADIVTNGLPVVGTDIQAYSSILDSIVSNGTPTASALALLLTNNIRPQREIASFNVTAETASLVYDIPSDINGILVEFENFAPSVDGGILQLSLGNAGAGGAFEEGNNYVTTQIFSNDGATAVGNILTTSSFALSGISTNSNPLLTANGTASLRGFNDTSNKQIFGELVSHYVNQEPRNSLVLSGLRTTVTDNWNAIRLTASGASNIATIEGRILGVSHG